MRTQELGQDIVFRAQYIESKVGKTGLTVTCNVWGPDGSLIEDGAAAAVDATEQPGLYQYTLDSAEVTEAGLYQALFRTATTSVAQQDIPDAVDVQAWVDSAADSEAKIDALTTNLTNLTNKVDTVKALDFEGKGWMPVGDHHALTLGGSATPLAAIPSRADGVLIQTTVQNTRLTLDGTTPTSGVGFLLIADAVPKIFPIVRLANGRGTLPRVLRVSAGAILQYQYVRFTD